MERRESGRGGRGGEREGGKGEGGEREEATGQTALLGRLHPAPLAMNVRCSHTDSTRYVQEPWLLWVLKDTYSPTGHCQTLGHDSEDRVVAADAGTIFLIVLLGVTDLKELWLQGEQPAGGRGKL